MSSSHRDLKLEFQTPGINVRGISSKIHGKIISHSVHYLLSAELLFSQQQKISRPLKENACVNITALFS
jgi:hypothetical protein